MCGIFAYVGSEQDAPQKIVVGLKKLEYRGYDSWGVAFGQDTKLTVLKAVGKIGSAHIDAENTSSIAIGHTRWATHGGITVENAHPHVSPDCTIAVVHNGVVDNFSQLKATQSTYPFKSETDTEVITALVSDEMKKHDLVDSIFEVSKKITGLNAFVVASAKHNTLVAYKGGSPLVIGKNELGYYIASDTSALAGITPKVLYVEDQDMVVITKKSVTILDANKNKKAQEWKLLTLTADSADKKAFPHFMIKEINEQPKIVKTLLSNQLPTKKMTAKKCMLVGCGSAYHASLAATYFLAKRGITAQAFTGSEFLPWRDTALDKDVLVIFVSQSGETIDIIEHAQWLKTKNIRFWAMVNREDSTLARLADTIIPLNAGLEICVLATKSFIAKLTLFLLLAREKVDQLIISSVKAVLDPTFEEKYFTSVVDTIAQKPHIFILGKHEMYPIALEAALKIKEGSYLHAEAFPSGELKHGVLALIETGTPVFVLIPESNAAADAVTAAQEVKARGGYIIGVGNPNRKSEVFDCYIPVTASGPAATIPISTVFQVIAYKTALALNRDPDKPRNIAKSVTVK